MCKTFLAKISFFGSLNFRITDKVGKMVTCLYKNGAGTKTEELSRAVSIRFLDENSEIRHADHFSITCLYKNGAGTKTEEDPFRTAFHRETDVSKCV